jgi:hypothetical protein
MHIGKRIKHRAISKKRQNNQITQRASGIRELLSLFVLDTSIEYVMPGCGDIGKKIKSVKQKAIP